MKDNLRVYKEARTAHLERALADGVKLVYLDKSYDFDQGMAEAAGACQLTISGIMSLVFSGRYSCVEINEPLMIQSWPIIGAVILAHRFSPFKERHRCFLTAYAIENGDVVSWVSGRLHLPHNISQTIVRFVGRGICYNLKRLAFGTEGAVGRYLTVLGPLPTSWREIRPLEPECPCMSSRDMKKNGILFLGSFEERKGLLKLLDAWPYLQRMKPDLSLTLIGKGPLEDRVRGLTGGLVNFLIDPSREEIHLALKRAKVVILFSQPGKRWREQIGLPILEGLSHGCEIVASSETGLAEWLTSHGHEILSHDCSSEQLAITISRAVDRPRRVDDLLEDLPSSSGRAEADKWLVGAG